MVVDAAHPVTVRVRLFAFVPMLVMLGLTGVAAYGFARQTERAVDPRVLAAAGVAADRAADELSRERYAAAGLLQAGGAAGEAGRARAALQERIGAADRAVHAVRAAAARAGLLTPALAADLDALGPLRDRAAAGPPDVPAGEYLMQYTQIVTDLVRLRQATDPARASGWLAVAREELAQVQLLFLRGADTPARRESLAAHRAAHLDALRRCAEAAPASWRDRLDRLPGGLDGDARAALDALTAVAGTAGADEIVLAGAERGSQQRTVVAGLAVLLALAAGAVAMAVLAARSLRARATRLAARRRTGGAEPAEDAGAGHLDDRGLTVAGIAAAAPGAPAALVGLARRNQRLADALLQQLDAAERDEADPDRLAQLFAFDHLATRIRHDNQSLLVLAGADAAPARREPVTLVDLLRAAQSRIEDYPRVEYVRIAADVQIVPEAVDDVVHLLAELFDNAVRHGPADRPVLVEGRRAGDGAVVEIADRGPGLDPRRLAEINADLADPPALAADGERAGLAVVARLAARHGLAVNLQRPSSGAGLRALVQLPAALVRLADPATPPAVRRPPPRPLERGQALPGGEPVDVPHPRTTLVPVVPGPVQTPDGPTVDVEPETARQLLQHPKR